MGSQAELLSKRIKRFGVDSIIIWLILSKVTYEFIHYFPYGIFKDISIPWIPWLNQLGILNEDLINTLKNYAVLLFFIMILVIIGIYEIHKYHKERKKPIKEDLEEEKEIFLPEPSVQETQPNIEDDSIGRLDSGDYKEDNNNSTEKSNDIV
jgi:hypothetical protein